MPIAVALLELGGILAALALTLTVAPGIAGNVSPEEGLARVAVLLLSCAVTFHYFDLYDPRAVRTWDEFTRRLAAAVPVMLIITTLGWLLVPHRGDTQAFHYGLLFVTVALLVPTRALAFSLLRSRLREKRVLILGHGSLAERIREELARHRSQAIVGESLPSETEEVERQMAELRPHVVVVALSERRGHLPARGLMEARFRGAEVVEGTDFYEEVARKVAIENLSPSNLIFCPKLTKSTLRLALHRAFSLCGGVLGLIAAAPAMALVALLVKLDSRGPVLFVQSRVGRRGRTFPLFKFRTMTGTPAPENDVWHRDDERRITRLGAFLRRSHLDELPQLFNVIAGHMNLVGPRPEMAENVPTMAEEIPYYFLRHMIRPGVTGWAQVRQGHAVTYEEVLEKTCYDLYYVKNMSLAFDMRILLETASILLGTRRHLRERVRADLARPVLRPAHVALVSRGEPAGLRQAPAPAPSGAMVRNALSVDLEEYYHGMEFEAALGPDRARVLPSRVEWSTGRVLDLLERAGVRATFFVVGSVAEAHPSLVRRVAAAGHEVACHGYAHELVSRQGPAAFREDIHRAKAILEDVTGQPVLGYRAPNYSIGAGQEWAWKTLIEEGFAYDSSIYPIHHDRYGDPNAPRFPHEKHRLGSRQLLEFPIGTLRLFGVNWPVGGGGFFRLLPTILYERAIRHVNRRERRGLMFYFHPWELDPHQPRPPMPAMHRFRHYVNLERYEGKIARFVRVVPFAPAREVLGLVETQVLQPVLQAAPAPPPLPETAMAVRMVRG